MCNTCIHKIVCSKYIACGEVKSCEHFKEERKGELVNAGGDLHYSGVLYFCSVCNKAHFVNGRHALVTLHYHDEIFNKPKYCPNCGADMRGNENG